MGPFADGRAGSRFPHHEHALGEEFLVLDGHFADERGEYPAGTYVRNPSGSGHTPWSEDGCVLFVKLRQFHPEDLEQIVVDTRSAEWFPGDHQRHRCPATARLRQRAGLAGPLNGAVEDEEGRYVAGSWLRNPPGSQHAPFSLEGCLLYAKIGHVTRRAGRRSWLLTVTAP